MTAQVHRHHPVPGVDELRREETILLFQVTKAWDHDDERAAAGVGEGDAAIRAI